MILGILISLMDRIGKIESKTDALVLLMMFSENIFLLNFLHYQNTAYTANGKRSVRPLYLFASVRSPRVRSPSIMFRAWVRSPTVMYAFHIHNS